MIEKGCVDMFADMAYCLCAADGHNRANTPLPVISHIVDKYKQYGVPADKLAILPGWFGCDFECLGGDHGSKSCDKAKLVGGPGFGQTLDVLANATSAVGPTAPLAAATVTAGPNASLPLSVLA